MTVTYNKNPSPELLSLIKKFSEAYIDTAKVWEDIKEKAATEGFTMDDLKGWIRPILKQRLSEGQIRYLFNKEELKEKQHVRDQERRKTRSVLQQIDPKKPLEQSDTYDDMLEKTEDAPVTHVIEDIRPTAEEMIKDLPPEMQAIAAKIQAPAEKSLDVVVVGRYGLFDTAATTKELIRDLGRVKSSGWKVVEITARYIS